MISRNKVPKAEQAQQAFLIRFYYPTRQDIPKLVKITQFDLDSYDWLEEINWNHQNKCTEMHPEIIFKWILNRDFRVTPMFSFKCRDIVDTRCKAKLLYRYDPEYKCFYLDQCNNEHCHLDRSELRTNINLVGMKRFVDDLLNDDVQEQQEESKKGSKWQKTKKIKQKPITKSTQLRHQILKRISQKQRVTAPNKKFITNINSNPNLNLNVNVNLSKNPNLNNEKNKKQLLLECQSDEEMS